MAVPPPGVEVVFGVGDVGVGDSSGGGTLAV